MRLTRIFRGLVLIAVATASGAQDHAFTVKDDIEMTRFSDPAPFVTDLQTAERSPDGRYFAVVTTRGLLISDRIESAITIFEREGVNKFLGSPSARLPRPRIVAKLVSFPHREEAFAYAAVIKDMRWSSDSALLYFRGENADGADWLYRVKVDGGAPEVLSPPGYSVTQYDVAANTVAYRAWSLAKERLRSGEASGDSINSDARAVTGYPLSAILFAGRDSNIVPKKTTLWISRKQHGRQILTSVPNSSILDLTYLPGDYTPFSLSPDGHKLIELAPIDNVPASWESYEPAKGYEQTQLRSKDPRLTGNNLYRPKRYTFVDLDTGRRVPLIDAPNGYALAYAEKNRVAWATDGQRVLVTNTFLPLDAVNGAERVKRTVPCAAASVEVGSREARCLIFNENRASLASPGPHVQSVAFGKSNGEAWLRLKLSITQKSEVVQGYFLENGSWTPASSGSTGGLANDSIRTRFDDVGNMELVVRQGLNESPKLWARDVETGQSKMIWDPNPQFARVKVGEASVYRWKDKTGYEWNGGLVKPVGYVKGTRYPLVIQIYNFYDDQFLTDGMMPSGFAARHLASGGIMVLQVQRKMLRSVDDAELQDHLEAFRSAIQQLSEEGLVDPKKVGVVGFSTTCQYVENALIKAPGMFSAATIVDGVDHSYLQYHLSMSLFNEEETERRIGAKPIGDGLKQWLKLALGFQLDQMQAPLRIEAIGPMSVLGEWEIYSSLKMQGKPVDMIYFPLGQHIHQRPLERLESQQGNVDWFRFWLQGYEDSDPTKRDQYRRWEKLTTMVAVAGKVKP
jgi:dipeptidyl aminopeptidase/acylaminoacyl peptidase